MSSITLNKLRVGNFTSSDIHKLMSSGKQIGVLGAPAMTYIQEKKLERRLGRSLDVDAYSKEIAWGNLLEGAVEALLEFGVEKISDVTKCHPIIEYWTGSTDFLLPGEKIIELKCYQPKNFCVYTDAILTKDTEVIKKDCPKEYWQMVSNAIINQVMVAEAITYMPYESELDAIRHLADMYDGPDQWKYRFIIESENYQLAYLPDNNPHYKNLNRFEFEVPKEDMDALTTRVEYCKSLLEV